MAEHFTDASGWLVSTPAAAGLPTETKLELYGLFKFANTGAGPTGSRPGMFSFEAKAKYDAWARVAIEYEGRVDGAKERYVEIATTVGWEEDMESIGNDGGGVSFGPPMSIMTKEEEQVGGETSVVHDAASAGAVNDLKAILVLDPTLLNVKDEFGFTPLHLAADRGHADAVAYLLSLGVDKSILDPDGQTAKEIAEISGRADVVTLLS